FQNALSELNGKRVRANRLPTVGVSTRFVTSDLQDINQTVTTAALRCDANTVSLKERSAPGEATISNITFSASEGTIQALQTPSTSTSGNLGALYRVATSDGSAPVGTFNITLLAPIGVSLVLFDMMDMPSNPTIIVSISTNGITYTPSANVNRNGYRVGAWFPAGTEAQYISIAITPALPDILGGNVFTFGLTDFHVFGIQYHLLSNLYTSQIQLTPIGAQLQFDAPTIPGIVYFLSLAGNPAIEVNPEDLVDIPGTTVVNDITSAHTVAWTGSAWMAGNPYSLLDTVIDSNGNLQTVTTAGTSGTPSQPAWSTIGGTTPDGSGSLVWTETAYAPLNDSLPSNVYLPSLQIIDNATQDVIRIAPGLSPSTIDLTNQYFALNLGTGELDL